MFQHMEKVLPELVPLFRPRFVTSGTLRARKPDPSTFALCLQRLGFANHSTLFVDDKPANVEGAKQAGLDAFVFENEEQFARELSARGFALGVPHAL
jgi:HAD superfamily hydrolase (TIGR01509 family)